MESNDQILDQTGESGQSSEVEQPDEADVLEETPAEAEFVDETAPEMVSEEVFEEEPAPEMDEGDFIAEADSDIHEEVAEPVGDEMSDQELFLAAINGEMEDDESDFMFTTLSKGQIVEGTIARMTNSEILVDVGAKTEGIISGRELDALDPELVESWQIGDVLKVFVLTPEDRSGNILLSVRRAKEAEDWEMAADYLESGEIYETKINNFNKGGLLVRFGRLRGFIPASQVGAQRRRRMGNGSPEERFGGMVGEEINVKVIEVNKDRNRLILSERAASKELRKERRTELLDELEEGQIRTGRVTSLTDFGAFVDLGGIDGLIHISQLAWAPVNHPRDVLSQGDEVTVEVISVDRDRERIGLSRKSQLADPWTTLSRDFHPDQLVQGEVTKLTNFGAFARLVELPAIEGLIHISELSDRRVGHPSEVVQEGQILTLRIIRIEPDRRRLGLSLKRASSTDYLEDDLGDWRSMLDDMNDF